MPDQPSSRLVLWDIDKTLVDIGGISREIYAAAFETVTDRKLEHMPDMAGKTDRDLILATLRLHEIPDPEKRLGDFYSALADATEACKTEIKQHGRCLPGAPAALELVTQLGLVQKVVTGNIQPIARAKLEAFGLADPMDFDIGGYGRTMVNAPRWCILHCDERSKSMAWFIRLGRYSSLVIRPMTSSAPKRIVSKQSAWPRAAAQPTTCKRQVQKPC